MPADGYSPLCPECGDPYIGGPGCYAGACAAEPEDDGGSRPVTAPNPEPVTNADEFSPWVASIVSAADVLRAYLDREAPDESRLLFNQDVEGMAMALDEAGRLLPPDADTRPGGWAVRVTMHNGVVSIRHGDDGFVTRESAEQTAAYARRHRTVAGAEVVTRSEWVGPWVPVPTTPDKES